MGRLEMTQRLFLKEASQKVDSRQGRWRRKTILNRNKVKLGMPVFSKFLIPYLIATRFLPSFLASYMAMSIRSKRVPMSVSKGVTWVSPMLTVIFMTASR